MITASFDGNLIERDETLKIMSSPSFKATKRGGMDYCLLGWLEKKPLIIRCSLKQWQELRVLHDKK